VRCSSYGNGLRSTTSSAKGPREHAVAHRGLELAGETAQGGRRRGPSGEDGGARGGRRCRGLRASGHRGSTRGGAVKVTRECGSMETRQRRSILVVAELTGNGGRGEIRRRERASVARVAVAV
jgi:hypothetical protein